MSQAEALLATLADDTSTYSSESEGYIVIGNDRFITVPESLKRIAVQYDHDIETVTFECPRFWDEHDMSQMKIYINYMLPNMVKGRYPAKNVIAKGSKMYFDWTISNNVTQYKGKLSVLVCIVKTDDDSNEKNHWNSELNQDMYISEGMECTESALMQYPDIITALLTRMDEVEAIATPEAMQAYTDTWLEENHDRILAEIEAKGEATLASIPEDYTTTYDMAEEGARTKADAIVCSAEGAAIVLSDSSDDYLRGMRVFGKTTQATTTGKNLIDLSVVYPTSSTTYTWSNETLAVTGYLVSVPVYGLNVGDTYTLSYESTRSGDTGGGFAIEFKDASDTKLNGVYKQNEYGTKSYTFTVPDTTYNTVLFFYGSSSTSGTTNASYTKVQLEYGSSATSYESYSGGFVSPSPDWPQEMTSIESPTIGICGGNLLDQSTCFSSTGDTSEISKTITENSIVLTGTPSRNYVQITTGYLTMPTYWRDQTMTFGVTIDGNQPHIVLYFRNASKTIIAQTGLSSTGTNTIHVPMDAVYYEFAFCLNRIDTGSAYTAVYSDMFLAVTDTLTEYEQYRTDQMLALAYNLPGIPVTSGGNYTDSNGQQWVCDEIDFERGVYVQRINSLELTGDETWWIYNNNNGVNQLYTLVRDCYTNNTLTNVMSPQMRAISVSNRAYNYNTVYTAAQGDYNYICFNIDGYSTVEEFQAFLRDNPILVLYRLAVPIETSLTAEEIANFKMVRTNYPNTTILNDAGAHMSAKYNADTKIYVDNHGVSEDSVQAAVDAWLTEHFSNAEEVSF